MVKPIVKYAVIVFLVLVSGPIAVADVILVPTDLAPGAQYRLAFVTRDGRDSMSSNIEDYNQFVSNQAGLNSALNSIPSWTAIASTFTVDARDNTNTNPSVTGVPIYTLQSVRIAASNSDLWDGIIAAPLHINQFGTTITSSVWTGSTASGQKSPFTFGFAASSIGSSSSDQSLWIEMFRTNPSGQQLPMYAISPVLTAPVPEPNSAVLIGIGLCGWSFARRRRTQNL